MQILKAWSQSKSGRNDAKEYRLMERAMEYLKFGYPVKNEEELNEVLKLCSFYRNSKDGVNQVLDKSGRKLRTLDVSLSLTDRCGNCCRHCSTNATMEKKSATVPFEKLDKALTEMSPYVKSFSISCEGDPFYYESAMSDPSGVHEKRDITDVLSLVVKKGFREVSIQSMAPIRSKMAVLKQMVSVIEQEIRPDQRFLPQISFNLYTPRAGLTAICRVDQDGHDYKVLCVPAVNDRDALAWMIQAIKSSKHDVVSKEIFKANNESYQLQGAAEKLGQYANDVKLTILEYAKKGYQIHFELRGDVQGGVTTLENTESLLTEIVRKLSEEHPEIAFPRCATCSRTHLDQKNVLVVPLGRAANLFPDGRREESLFFDKHVKMNQFKYLCDNWFSWGCMVIDTQGYPQLCYSNVGFTPDIRTTVGPNLYDDGFEEIREFYNSVWKDRYEFLKKNLPVLVRSRPNNNYCPFRLFKETLRKFN